MYQFSDDVKERFDKLKARYEEDEMNEHAKGQFEWVDGILVKSLKQGDWLLIDNVNFCRSDFLYSIILFSFIQYSAKISHYASSYVL